MCHTIFDGMFLIITCVRDTLLSCSFLRRPFVNTDRSCLSILSFTHPFKTSLPLTTKTTNLMAAGPRLPINGIFVPSPSTDYVPSYGPNVSP